MVPLWALWSAPEYAHQGIARWVSLSTALAAASPLVLTFVLPSRFWPLTGDLGVERVLRGHRALALTVVALVLVHVVAVLLRPGPGLALLDLRSSPPRVWAASIATLSLHVLWLGDLTRYPEARGGSSRSGWPCCWPWPTAGSGDRCAPAGTGTS